LGRDLSSSATFSIAQTTMTGCPFRKYWLLSGLTVTSLPPAVDPVLVEDCHQVWLGEDRLVVG
jgi:hypothetical protein